MINKSALATYLRQHFRLDWHGVHGAPHWARVRRYGLYIAQGTAADREVITLFALLHDSCREDEHSDHYHGGRAAHLAEYLNGRCYQISSTQEQQLVHAIERHSGGHMSDDLTVQSCWDADRLDLGRLGILTSPGRLGSERAKQLCHSPWPYREAMMATGKNPS